MALTATITQTEPRTSAKGDECASERLTAIRNDSERCGNPFCVAPITIKAQKGKRYCYDQCRMDGYALRRAKALLAKVGTVRFHAVMDKL